MAGELAIQLTALGCSAIISFGRYIVQYCLHKRWPIRASIRYLTLATEDSVARFIVNVQSTTHKEYAGVVFVNVFNAKPRKGLAIPQFVNAYQLSAGPNDQFTVDLSRSTIAEYNCTKALAIEMVFSGPYGDVVYRTKKPIQTAASNKPQATRLYRRRKSLVHTLPR
jgi:hypothetical protein